MNSSAQTILVVTSEKEEIKSLQNRYERLSFRQAFPFPATAPAEPVGMILTEAHLTPAGELPTWCRQTPLLMIENEGDGKSPRSLPRFAAMTHASFTELDLTGWLLHFQCRSAASGRSRGQDNLIARLDYFSRRVLEKGKHTELARHLPLWLSTLATFDGLAFADLHLDTLVFYSPRQDETTEQNALLEEIRLVWQSEMPLPGSIEIVPLVFGRTDEPNAPIRHRLDVAVGESEGRLLFWRTGRTPFTAAEKQLMHQAANLIAFSMRNARLLLTLESQTAKIIEKNRELLKAGRLKTNFIANTSHELKTPLHSILGLADLLTETVDMHDIRTMADRIAANARRLLNTVNDLLDFSNLVSADHETCYEFIELNDFLEETVAGVRDIAAAKNLELTWSNDAGIETVICDREKLFQILVNLLSNAIKYTPTGSVHLNTETADPWLHILVEDTGIGIPEAEHKKIFEQFHRVRGPLQNSIEGAGLGLTIAQGLARLLDGKITVQSAPDRGSRFTLSIPPAPTGRQLPTSLALPDPQEKGIT